MVKVKPVQNGRTSRMSFSRINEVIGMPNLIEIQKNSYNWFLDEGLREVFHDIDAIEDYTGNLSLEFVDYRLDKHPKYTIKECKDGESYYFVRIKHFGDDMTPWNTDETTKPSTSSIYPEDHLKENYLGRYGVLRNNWYDIAVEKVVGLGSATVPEVTTTTDDELKSYIAVRINVLSWAKRTQSATLGE